MLLLSLAVAAPLWPQMQVSAATVDFDVVEPGNTATVPVQVTNAGEMPMGLAWQLNSSPPQAFSLAWPESGACDDGTPFVADLDLAAAPQPPDAILPPGCVVTFKVSFAPHGTNGAAGAVVFTALGAYRHGASVEQAELPAFAEDPREWRQEVSLTATALERAQNTEPAMLAMHGSPDTCHSGEEVAFSADAFDADGQALIWNWSNSEKEGVALFDSNQLGSPTFTCPEQTACAPAESVEVIAMATDADGHQAWLVTTVAVLGEAWALADPFDAADAECHPPAPEGSDPDDPACDCAGGAGSALVAPGIVAVWRRRRRAER